eukprot:TRINITY_DN51573_c0_g1_i1.p1 TRINITY_DN51573_c0_g1~~TRINITY_DN51573_c0_g1_i1.p1  ORF type:complete len:106 (+),score=28.70 TRINITY_DN51573_c0_g1_i1:173-490(+)
MAREHPELTWEVADLTDCKAQLLDGAYDVALDKGTLDALLCHPSLTELFFEVNRFLAIGGSYIIISVLTSAELLDQIAQISGLGFRGRATPVQDGRFVLLSLIHI